METRKPIFVFWLGAWAIAVVVFTSCRHDVPEAPYAALVEECNIPPAVTFLGDIQAITATQCAISGCHTGIEPAAGLHLDSHSQVRSIATSGDMSLRVLVREDMPPTGPLSECDQELIRAWINQGAPEY